MKFFFSANALSHLSLFFLNFFVGKYVLATSIMNRNQKGCEKNIILSFKVVLVKCFAAFGKILVLRKITYILKVFKRLKFIHSKARGALNFAAILLCYANRKPNLFVDDFSFHCHFVQHGRFWRWFKLLGNTYVLYGRSIYNKK